MDRSGMRRCGIEVEQQLAAGERVQCTGKADHSLTTEYADSITVSACTADGVLFDDVVAQDSTDWQWAC
ncbi:hypothetical protein AADR41_17905 [Streptomyces sp. CLV115]|uniref:hypothetical protein n=1 Tax=Streptomyces sp. CLV115 TaxID=3138502 RepID=UPI00313AC818